MEREAGRSRKEKALETKKHLPAAADTLFMQDGLGKVSVNRIAEEAWVAKGTFNVRLESKNGLLDALANHPILAMHGILYEGCIRNPDFDLQAHA